MPAPQVKRTDELARKLRFFTDQVEKAALITGSRTSATESLDLDGMEVRHRKPDRESLLLG